MPFFFILPVWLLCVITGVLLFFFKRFRFLSVYLVRNEQGWRGLTLIAAYLASIIVGGVVGAAAGFVAAAKMNRRLGGT
jgi:hypothetical protein